MVASFAAQSGPQLDWQSGQQNPFRLPTELEQVPGAVFSSLVLPPRKVKRPDPAPMSAATLARMWFARGQRVELTTFSLKAPLEKLSVVAAALGGLGLSTYKVREESWKKRLAEGVKGVSAWAKAEPDIGGRVFGKVKDHFAKAKDKTTLVLLPWDSAHEKTRVFSLTFNHPKWVHGFFTLPGLFHGSLIASAAEIFEFAGGSLAAALQTSLTRQSGLLGTLASYSIGNVVSSVISLVGLSVIIGHSTGCGCAEASQSRRTPGRSRTRKVDIAPHSGFFFGPWGFSVGAELKDRAEANKLRRHQPTVNSKAEPEAAKSLKDRVTSLTQSLPSLMGHLTLHKLAELPGVALGGAVASGLGGSVVVGATIGNILASFVFHLTFEVYRHHRFHVIKEKELRAQYDSNLTGSFTSQVLSLGNI